MTQYLLIVYVPITHAALVREALAEHGAGKLGNYDFCSFSSQGTGRFRPLKRANPAIGTAGKLEEVDEERIEVLVRTSNESELKTLIAAMRKAHPYEEPAFYLTPILDPTSL